MLHLDVSALPLSLFLYHTSMDANIEPDIYVMTRAWYGVVPTGAQAAVAIKMLTDLSCNVHPVLSRFFLRIFMLTTLTLELKLRLHGMPRFHQPS